MPGVITGSNIKEVLEHPEDYIDGAEFFSWEQFFTALLERHSSGEKLQQYDKAHLSKFYTSEKNVRKILRVMPDELQEILGNGKGTADGI